MKHQPHLYGKDRCYRLRSTSTPAKQIKICSECMRLAQADISKQQERNRD